MVPFRYRDRTDAGRSLAEALVTQDPSPNPIVLALPRGGVPVAYEVAVRLRAPLDVFVVRKLGVPDHEELAMGAVAGDRSAYVDVGIIASLGIAQDAVDAVVRRELAELHRREAVYRDGRPEPNLTEKTVYLVDDGLATGSTMRVAVRSIRNREPASIVVAVPVAARRTCAELGRIADRVVCLHTPEPFHAVGLYYEDFSQTSDDQVRALLHSAAEMEANRWRVA